MIPAFDRSTVASRVPWIGDIPDGWSVEKFRYLFRESSEKIETEVVGDMLSVSGYRGIEIKEYDDDNRRRSADDLIGYRIVRPGQLVVNTMWLNYAGLGVSAFEGYVSPAYRSYDFLQDVDRRYVHYLMRCSIYVQGYTRLLTGIRPNSLQMSREDLMDFPVLLPPLSEQAAIAAFLDRETGKIDALVEEQKRLIELLKEKRMAVISHAVTKGLNPNTRTKDCGVEWLGHVPEHWSVTRIARGWRLQGGFAFSSSDFGNEGVPVVRMNNLNRGRLRLEEASRIPSEVCNESVALAAGDLVWGMSGSVGETGSLGNYARVNEADLPCQLNQRVGRFVPRHSEASLDFLEWVIQSQYFYQQVLCHVTGTAQFNISSDQVQSCAIALPPLSEMVNIVEHLRRTTDRYDQLHKEAEQAILLLQQRRAVLISAAVTGKIDVRGSAAAPVDPRGNAKEPVPE